ncbi:hypothetical protein D9758_008608 [Tetrapyrgos nigripes]|uniref:Decapping nuclease n=1 Tax=Tetrapyrgos nigripes TaxID=182062 RepID=A0A8H5FYB4_9AGAR|nr:hypothetical protein D9758_008608 [Tetrapyrgos nigripes]
MNSGNYPSTTSFDSSIPAGAVSTSSELDRPTLGECHFVSDLTILEDFYECNDTAMRYFVGATSDSATSDSLTLEGNGASHVNLIGQPNVTVSLTKPVQNILKKRPFRWFNHPKHLDSIISACLSAAPVPASGIGESEYLAKENVVITWRGILTKIFLGDTITMHASLIDGRLYMEEEDPKPNWKAKKYSLSDAVGKAFEDTFTETRPIGRDGLPRRIPKANTQWCNVVSRTLGDLNLIFGGEVDAFNCKASEDLHDNHGILDRRVELKTKLLGSKIHYPRWHMQSHLLAVPQIFVGYRNDNLDIVKTQSIHTANIRPRNFEENIAKGYRVLSVLRGHLSRSAELERCTRLQSSTSASSESHTNLDSPDLGLDKLCLKDPAIDTTWDTNTGTGASDDASDCIWKVTIRKWTIDSVHLLSMADAQRVKERRENPSKPVERLGIVPKVLIDAMHTKYKLRSANRVLRRR